MKMKNENIKKYFFISSLIILLLFLSFNSPQFSKTKDMNESIWIEHGCGMSVCGVHSCNYDEMCQSSIPKKLPDYQIYLPPQIPLSPLRVKEVSTSKTVPDYLVSKSFFVDRKYRCHQTLDCIDTCNDNVDNDADAMEDVSDPSCSSTKNSDRTAPRACRTLFDSRISSDDFMAEGSGQCLDDFVQESCLALNIGNEKWTDIINLEYLHSGSVLNNNGLCNSWFTSCCVQIKDEGGQPTPIYNPTGTIYSEADESYIGHFKYCGDDSCQGWNEDQTIKLPDWFIESGTIFMGETFNSCHWTNIAGTPLDNSDDFVESDCNIEPYSCTVTDNPVGMLQYFPPIGNLYLSNLTNAHVANSPGSYDYRVYCSYAYYTMSPSQEFNFLRIESTGENAHVESTDYSSSGYTDYKINTEGDCFIHDLPGDCPADTTTQSFCVFALSNVTNAHVADCSEETYDYKLCCNY